MTVYHYLSLQYSAIQKTLLRHDRLWSISGISQIMAKMNELDMKKFVEASSGSTGKVLVAGGGKFTARFDSDESAKKAKKEIIKLISTTLPMLEFQVSEIIPAESMIKAKEHQKDQDEKITSCGIIDQINEKKRCFRGYAVSFNPHLKFCEQCGEYPAVEKIYYNNKKELLCSICNSAYNAARISFGGEDNKDDSQFTTLQRIYRKLINDEEIENKQIPLNFEDIYPKNKDSTNKGRRMAVWFSDLNNMNDKVPLWLAQIEDSIPGIFEKIKKANIDIIAEALLNTFKEVKDSKHNYLPFRLIVAGGDDLRIVMAEEYILDFVKNIDASVQDKINSIGENEPLKTTWLQAQENSLAKSNKRSPKTIKPYSFGGSFVVTSLHTPFSKIHEACEDLMSEAKRETNREGNSVNWKVISVEEDPLVSKLMNFEKPLLIDKEHNGKLSFNTYLNMRKFYSKILSNSQRQQIASKIIDFGNDSIKVEEWLKQFVISELDKKAAFILVDGNFRKSDKTLDCSRLATLLELMSIKGKEDLQ